MKSKTHIDRVTFYQQCICVQCPEIDISSFEEVKENQFSFISVDNWIKPNASTHYYIQKEETLSSHMNEDFRNL